MARRLVCFTVDTDPDGMTAQVMNRRVLRWRGMEAIEKLLNELETLRSAWGAVPVTWFIRADRQIQDSYGSVMALYERFAWLWDEVRAAGHELGWHPHLYRRACDERDNVVLSDPRVAAEEIRTIWSELSAGSFEALAFRNGEGWHHPETLAMVERLGFRWDCTAIPGRKGADGHPMNWMGAPNGPYFPGNDIRRAGKPRQLLELPLNTWCLQAPYDPQPRLRYIDPAVHEALFSASIPGLQTDPGADLEVWTMVVHPDEVLDDAAADALYSRSVKTACRNLNSFARVFQEQGHNVQFVAISQAGREWRSYKGAP